MTDGITHAVPPAIRAVLKAEFFGSEQGGDGDVSSGFDLSASTTTTTQAVEDEGLLRFG